MRLPSVERLAAGARDTARRFPAVVACALVSALAAMAAVDAGAGGEPWIRLLVAASLGLPLFTGLALLAERRRWSGAGAWGARAGGLALLALFYWRWPSWGEPNAVLRYFHASLTLHLAVAVVPYLGVREPNGFWQYNRALFLRFLLAGVYSGVLFVGLAIALAGIDNLLGVAIADEQYARLFFLIGFVLQTWFFLAGVPRSFAALDASRDYPVGLRVFAQYVLVPLVSVYLIILTAYLGRVLVTTTWPSGWIGYLVSALAALGILSLLLVHPERHRPDQPWIDRYARVFWLAILPSVAMLLMAVWQRIDQYGITERRYLLLALALWLAAVALAYAISRSRDIRLIPLTLGAVGLATFVGPWSAYAVAERSQVGRLAGLLERHGALAEGRVMPAPAEIPAEDWRQVSDILRYLIEHHGTGAIDPWFEGGVAAVDTLAVSTEPGRRGVAGDRAALIVGHLGLEPAGGLPTGPGGYVYYQAHGEETALEAEDFDYVLPRTDLVRRTFVIGGRSLEIDVVGDPPEIVLRRDGALLLQAFLEPLLKRGLRRGSLPRGGTIDVPRDSLRLDLEGDGVAARIYFDRLTVRAPGDSTRVTHASGTVLLRLGG